MKKKKFWNLAVRLFVSFFILFFLFYGMRGNLPQVKSNILSLHVLTFLLGLLVYFLVSLLGACRLKVLMHVHEIRLSFLKILKNIYIGYLFNLFLLGSTGGDVVRSYYIAKETNRKTEIVTLIFFDRLIGMITMMCIALSSLIFNLHDPRLKKMALAVFILLLAVIVFVIGIFSKDKLKRFPVIQMVLSKIAFRETLKKISDTMHVFRNHKRKVFLGIFLSAVIQSLAIISCYIVSLSITGIKDIPLRYFFLMMPIIFMGSALPVSLGGWGIFEGGFVFCFALAGISEGDSLSMGLMNRLILIILGVIGAVLYVMPGTEHIAARAIEEGIEELEEEAQLP
ncbi:MAG: flippase-like domain-containing protein [Candidatus Aureabacteria bacterium]|nr:flippase-like domain-containing protein [Candidatus Auribacterota bacterium]